MYIAQQKILMPCVYIVCICFGFEYISLYIYKNNALAHDIQLMMRLLAKPQKPRRGSYHTSHRYYKITLSNIFKVNPETARLIIIN